MKTTIRITFALLLSSVPAGQVVAQTAPEALARTDVLLQEAAAVGPEASVPTPLEALLWQPVIENAETPLEPTAVPAPMPRAWSDWSTEKKVLVIGGGVLALIILGIVSIG